MSLVDIFVPGGIEGIWRLATARDNSAKVGKIAIGSFYLSPQSKFKDQTIEHIVEVIHCLRSQHEKMSFLIGGDFNKVSVQEILLSYGALKQICSIPTRKNISQEVILTDIGHLFHPPTSLPPLQVDRDKKGKDSDHNIVILAPKSNSEYCVEQKKREIKFRPLPSNKIPFFVKTVANHTWQEVYEVHDINEKVNVFHQTYWHG